MRIYIALVLLIAIGFLSCDNGGEKAKEDSLASCKTKSLNPNGDSELAILMREMAAVTDSAKQDLINHRSIDPAPENFKTILTAKKTDETIDKSKFTSLADNYLYYVSEFYSAPEDKKNEAYNSMVNACVNCHQNFCGGPIKRINKLFLKN